MDENGRTLFCFQTPDGVESPTLVVKPGDKLEVTVTNNVPTPPGAPSEVVSGPSNQCGAATMTISSTNLHFHGTNVSPQCHSDEVVHTLINSGQTFHYSIHFPLDEPPGLYWYHQHIHGTSEPVALGGATGAIIVEGIGTYQPAVLGLPQRVLVVRDQNVIAKPKDGVPPPGWDVSLNYVPINYPAYGPAIIATKAGRKEFWRVVNASANTVMHLRLVYDGAIQPLGIVAFDGVPTNSQDGMHRGTVLTQDHVRIPPAGRAEFIVTTPSASVKKAVFETLKVATGPDGDNDPERPLAAIKTVADAASLPVEATPGEARAQRFEGLREAVPTAHRNLYFSEGPAENPENFFITVVGQKPKLFSPNNPPAITTTQGAVEDWTIENRSTEVHEFHIHQIHFLLLEVNGVPVRPEQQQMFDTYQVGFWQGPGHPFPSIKVRMDFRGPTVGDFVYHCHILNHEDAGMMAIIRVKPRG